MTSVPALSVPWIDKYRPTSFDEVVSQKNIIKTIEKLIDKSDIPHLLFYGPPGTGKTSTIMVCARKLYGKYASSMVLELNASNDNGINIIREQIKDFAGTHNMFLPGIKLIILDEATSYIDTETEQQIQAAFLNLMKNRTSIIIAHRLSTARSANRILVLYNGRIIESGSHDELMDEQGFYFRLNQLNS